MLHTGWLGRDRDTVILDLTEIVELEAQIIGKMYTLLRNNVPELRGSNAPIAIMYAELVAKLRDHNVDLPS